MSAAAASSSSSSSSSSNEELIDEALYSRQLYVMDVDAQRRLAKTNVLIAGLSGLGVEIAKNVILAGVGSVTLVDNEKVSVRDLASQFYLRPSDVGSSRAAACLDSLRSLNSYVRVSLVSTPLSIDMLKSSSSSSNSSSSSASSSSSSSASAYDMVVLIRPSLPSSSLFSITSWCHTNGVKVMIGDAFGVAGLVFSDFGPHHPIVDTNGEPARRGLISHVSNASRAVVTVHEESRHGLEDGDMVTFEEIDGGMKLLNQCAPIKIRVLTPFSFQLDHDTSSLPEFNSQRGYFVQVKQRKTIAFKDLASTIDNPSLVDDFTFTSRRLHGLWRALIEFRSTHAGARGPAADSDVEVQQLFDLALKYQEADSSSSSGENAAWLHHVARGASAELSPITSVIGGMIGQEVLKAASLKFGPIQQYFYLDGSAALPDKELQAKEYAPAGTRYDDQIAVFGRELNDRIRALRYFVVGAGAIGCEMLKNFALMGVGTDSGGRGGVFVTDMDTIEKSNLNRQFLFRNHDVGQLKSVTAAKAVTAMNNDVRVQAQSVRVAPSTEDVYDERFWESLDGVVTALDNVEARLYVDQRCVYFQKPLIDSGTLGLKGSTQVVVPFLTESYGSSRDPPEESIPICTLKNFPNKIEHTIQWAREQFEGWFKSGPEEVNAYLNNANYLSELERQPNTQLQSLQTLKDFLVDYPTGNLADCVKWARFMFDFEYSHKILQLLYVFPPDSKTAEGASFWSGPKRPPRSLTFDGNDPDHVAFIRFAANLRAHVFNIPLSPEHSSDWYRSTASAVSVPAFKAESSVKIPTTDAEAKQMQENTSSSSSSLATDDFEVKIKELIASLPSRDKLKPLQPCSFEKDNDTNFHIDFISACSNLRARNYVIKEADRRQTKQIAGKIIPAIATTTALVTGLVCLEMYKLALRKPLAAYRNATVNLALPLAAFAEPLAPHYSTVQLKTGEWKWSLWDRIDVDFGGEDVTLKQFIDHFDEKFGLEVTMVSHGAAMLFYNFGMAPKKLKERMASKMSDLVRTVGKVEVPASQKYLVLETSVANANGDDQEIPYVRYRFRP